MKKENIKQIEYFNTPDLSLTTALSLWFPICEINRDNPHKVTFQFKKTNKLAKTIELFWQGKLMVDPQKYFLQLKTIKSRIYSER